MYEAALIKGKGAMVKCDNCEDKDINTLLAEVTKTMILRREDSFPYTLSYRVSSRLRPLYATLGCRRQELIGTVGLTRRPVQQFFQSERVNATMMRYAMHEHDITFVVTWVAKVVARW